MTLIAWQATVQDDEGNVIVNPEVTVRRASDDELADIFDSEGAALDNPYTGTSEGFVQFFAQPGKYTIQGARGGSVTQTWTVDLTSPVGKQYPSRSDFEDDVAAGYAPADGTVVAAGGLQYVRSAGATELSGLPGWLPFGPRVAGHAGFDELVTVGSGGNFPTINAALDATFAQMTAANKTLEIRLLAGFVMAEQVFALGRDYTYATITAEDATVSVTRSALTQGSVVQSAGTRFPVFYADNGGNLPIIGALFDMDTSGTADARDGVFVAGRSAVLILRDCGVINAGGHGLHVRGASQAEARFGKFDGAGETGIKGFDACTINVRLATATGAGEHGIHASDNANVSADSVDVSGAAGVGVWAEAGCMINFQRGKAEGCGTYGVWALGGGIISCRQSDLRNAGTAGAYASHRGVIQAADYGPGAVPCDTSGSPIGFWARFASTISARNSIAENCSDAGYRIEGGSTAHIFGGNASGCDIGVLAEDGSTVDFRNGVAADCTTYGVNAFRGSRINARGCTATGCGADNLRAEENSEINAQGSDITGALNRAALVFDRSEINLRGADVTGAAASSLPINHNNGSIVHVTGVTGSLGDLVANEITSRGIAFAQDVAVPSYRDFGVGVQSNLPTTISDLNEATTSGYHGVTTSADNRPVSTVFSSVVHVIRDAAGGRIVQQWRVPGSSAFRLRIWERVYDGSAWSSWEDVQVTLSGSSRPTQPSTGLRFFDTTLGIPVWWDGTNWVDATGETV